MEAIVRSLVLAWMLASPLDEARGVLASMATDLSAGNVSGFLSATAKDLEGRDELRQQLVSMVSTYDLNSSVEIQSIEGTEQRQTAKVDWYLAGRTRTDDAIRFQRREVLTIDFTRSNRKWLVTRLEPRAFFNP